MNEVIVEIEKLVSKMLEKGEEIAPFIYVDMQTYKILKLQMAQQSHCNTSYGYTSISVFTAAGQFNIKCDPTLPANMIRNNGRTFLDIVVEEELLGI